MAGVYVKCWAQKRQVRTYFCLEWAGNLCDKTWKDAASHWRERALNVEKKWKNAASQPRSEPEEEEDEPDEPDEPDDDDDVDDDDVDDDDVDDDDDAPMAFGCDQSSIRMLENLVDAAIVRDSEKNAIADSG